MSLWYCPTCKGLVHCPVGSICPNCGDPNCDRITSVIKSKENEECITKSAQEEDQKSVN